MAKRQSLLSAAIPKGEANENTAQTPEKVELPAVAEPAPKRRQTNAGKYHLGGYFDYDDPTAEAFRVLAARSRRKQQDLLAEAIADLVAKYENEAKFGKR